MAQVLTNARGEPALVDGWTIDDVKTTGIMSFDITLTTDQALRVMHRAVLNYDLEIGINLNSLDSAIKHILYEDEQIEGDLHGEPADPME